ncbi:peptidoglycan recognition family protein [Actinomadura sp. NPDC049382]|uniref:peptidoglycan recognition protein family protein n=1 Tax=Actinomadura sp. NPDC049382 TaxID=3158220 RepID=UPI00341D3E49
MKLEKRSAFGWPATAASSAPCKNGLVVHYDGSNQGLAGKSHASCRAYWKATRKFHMGPARGWLDIGYSFGVCPHGIVMEGRGWQRQQAAQPGGNSTWTSVTFMSGDDERPTAAQVAAFKELRAWLRGKGLGSAIRGHRDFISTSCPGSTLYSMVKSGALAGAAGKDDDMPLSGNDAKFIADAVWRRDEIAAPDDNPKNPTWWASSHLVDHGRRLREILAKVNAQGAAIGELSKAVASLAADRGEAVDADALLARIEAAIERVTVRLDVQPDTEQS